MMVFPSGVRQTSVPRNQIVTVSLLDIPSRKNGPFTDAVDEHGSNVDVFDLVIVLVWLGSDFDSSHQNVFKPSGVPGGLDGL